MDLLAREDIAKLNEQVARLEASLRSYYSLILELETRVSALEEKANESSRSSNSG